ncbi:MAG: hypothetical protein NVSMB51_07540 [Solirubrobacteraceae bacterium]
MSTDALDMMLPSNRDAPGHARQLISRFVAGRLPPLTCEYAQLLVSELATNAVQYASADSLRLRLELDAGCLHVDVIDAGPGFAPPAHPEPRSDRAGGFGLYLLERTADRWGVVRNGACRVWFELNCPGRAAAI